MLSAHFLLQKEISEIQWKMYICRHVLYPPFLLDFWWNLKLLDVFSKNTQISKLMKIRPVRAELFHANGQTYMTNPLVAHRNYSGKAETKVARLVKLNTFGGGRHPGSCGTIPRKYTVVFLS
jgi:hypothetical protein